MKPAILSIIFALVAAPAVPQDVAQSLELSREVVDTQKRIIVAGSDDPLLFPDYMLCTRQQHRVQSACDRAQLGESVQEIAAEVPGFEIVLQEVQEAAAGDEDVVLSADGSLVCGFGIGVYFVCLV